MTDATTYAYLAGMIDGDGFISITRGVHSGSIYHGPQIGISGTRREPHDLASSLWGGRVYAYVPKNPAHRVQFQWSRCGAAAARAIEAVLPFLRIKADHAALALALWDHIETGRHGRHDPFPWFGPSYDPAGARDAMRDEMIEMNQSRDRLRGAR